MYSKNNSSFHPMLDLKLMLLRFLLKTKERADVMFFVEYVTGYADKSKSQKDEAYLLALRTRFASGDSGALDNSKSRCGF